MALAALAAHRASADEPPVPDCGLVFYPSGPGEGRHGVALGGLWQVAPQVVATWRYGLPRGFTVGARLEVVGVRNELDIGATWFEEAGPFLLGVGTRFGGWFGFLSGFGFRSTAWGILWQPGLSAGIRVAHDSWVTVSLDGYFDLHQVARLGTLTVVPAERRFFEGLGALLTVELAAWKGVIYYGAGLFYTSPNYPAWIAFDYGTRAKYLYPSVVAGYEF